MENTEICVKFSGITTHSVVECRLLNVDEPTFINVNVTDKLTGVEDGKLFFMTEIDGVGNNREYDIFFETDIFDDVEKKWINCDIQDVKITHKQWTQIEIKGHIFHNEKAVLDFFGGKIGKDIINYVNENL